MVSFQRESALDVIKEGIPLFDAHHKELTLYQDIRLDIDFAAYKNLEQINALRVFTVRFEEKLVGYAVFYMLQHLHYRSSKQAECMVLFIVPELRGKGLGRDFITWCDEQLRLESVQVVFHHVKASNDFAPLLSELGYGLVEHIYSRRLD